MKKLLNILLIVISIFLTSQVFAQYYLIPANKTEEYRSEINREIEKQYPKIIKQIDNVENEIINEKDPFEKERILDMGIDGILFDFYIILINITEKYIGKGKILDDLATDFSGALYGELFPYLMDNKTNISKINYLIDYSNKKQKKLQKKYSEAIYKLMYPNK